MKKIKIRRKYYRKDLIIRSINTFLSRISLSFTLEVRWMIFFSFFLISSFVRIVHERNDLELSCFFSHIFYSQRFLSKKKKKNNYNPYPFFSLPDQPPIPTFIPNRKKPFSYSDTKQALLGKKYTIKTGWNG